MAKRKKELDKSVTFTFIILSIFAFLISAYKLNSGKDCSNVSFSTAETEIEAGKVIHFVDNNIPAHSWEWSFGDSSEVEFEKNPLHIFRTSGTYKIKLRVDNSCEYIKFIAVKARKVDSTGYPTFVAPAKAMVGEKVRFFDTTRYATSWEWRFGESFDKISRERDPVFMYTTPGIKNVILVVNGKNQYYTKKQIMVLEKVVATPKAIVPPPPKKTVAPPRPPVVIPPVVPVTPPVQVVKPEVKDVHVPITSEAKAPDITSDFIKKLFIQIENKSRRVEDLAPYICENYMIPVTTINVRNSATKSVTLKDFAKNIKGYKIIDVFITKDPQTKCITAFKIEYKYSDW